jgi:hypothetical protein
VLRLEIKTRLCLCLSEPTVYLSGPCEDPEKKFCAAVSSKTIISFGKPDAVRALSVPRIRHLSLLPTLGGSPAEILMMQVAGCRGHQYRLRPLPRHLHRYHQRTVRFRFSFRTCRSRGGRMASNVETHEKVLLTNRALRPRAFWMSAQFQRLTHPQLTR